MFLDESTYTLYKYFSLVKINYVSMFCSNTVEQTAVEGLMTIPPTLSESAELTEKRAVLFKSNRIDNSPTATADHM